MRRIHRRVALRHHHQLFPLGRQRRFHRGHRALPSHRKRHHHSRKQRRILQRQQRQHPHRTVHCFCHVVPFCSFPFRITYDAAARAGDSTSKTIPPPRTSTRTFCPSRISPATNFLASGVSSSFCIARFSGLAP